MPSAEGIQGQQGSPQQDLGRENLSVEHQESPGQPKSRCEHSLQKQKTKQKQKADSKAMEHNAATQSNAECNL